jgi:hypothetical protein
VFGKFSFVGRGSPWSLPMIKTTNKLFHPASITLRFLMRLPVLGSPGGQRHTAHPENLTCKFQKLYLNI